MCVRMLAGLASESFLRYNFLAGWPWGSLLWLSLRASGVNLLFCFSRVSCDKRQKEAMSSSSLASSPIFLPYWSLRTESNDTAHFSSCLPCSSLLCLYLSSCLAISSWSISFFLLLLLHSIINPQSVHWGVFHPSYLLTSSPLCLLNFHY